MCVSDVDVVLMDEMDPFHFHYMKLSGAAMGLHEVRGCSSSVGLMEI